MEILRHFVFVTPSQELFLLEEKKEVESEPDLTVTSSSVKVRSEQLTLTLAGLQAGAERVLPSAFQNLSVVVSLASLGILPEDPK